MDESRMIVIGGLGGERKNEKAKKRARLMVGISRGSNDDGHAADRLDPVIVDFGEHDLFLQSHRVIAASVERLRVHAAEVANARQRNRDQTVEKLVHPLAAKRHLAADRHAFAQLEAGDRLLGPGDDRLLADRRRKRLKYST